MLLTDIQKLLTDIQKLCNVVLKYRNESQELEMTTMNLLPASPRPRRAPVRPGAVTVVVCLALAAVVAAMSSLNVALPDIARTTHASQTQLAWVVDAYSLVFASLLLPAGAMGDRYGAGGR